MNSRYLIHVTSFNHILCPVHHFLIVLAEINGFVAAFPTDQDYLVTRDSSIEQPFLFKISSNGNSKALEDPLTFVVGMSLNFILPFVDFALVIFQERVTITIADLDGN